MRILIICTGNSCRSQMAEGFIRSLDPSVEVFSAGTCPADEVNPMAVLAMKEAGIDISGQSPKPVTLFERDDFDFVVTVCDSARCACPELMGSVGRRVHIGFDDPYEAQGSPEVVLAVYRRVRDEIIRDFTSFYNDMLMDNRDNSQG